MLLLENIKHEVESLSTDLGGTPFESASKRRASLDNHAVSEADIGVDTMLRRGSESLKVGKQEDGAGTENGDTTFHLFASLLDSALQGTWNVYAFEFENFHSFNDTASHILHVIYLEIFFEAHEICNRFPPEYFKRSKEATVDI